ncbi:MAG: HAMP domain-containing sensor histidine kinase [Bacillota bacterium]|nr:HAMP domain-containing sensor histidine kinase [Bacillota bacterium]
MKKGLFSKMVATYTVIITISFIIIAAFLSFWFQSYYFAQKEQQLKEEAQFLGGPVIQFFRGGISTADIIQTIEARSKYLKTNIIVTDDYGYVRLVSNPDYDKFIGQQILTSDLDSLRKGLIVKRVGDYGQIFKVPVHTYEVPIAYHGVYKAVIMMSTSVTDLKEPLKDVYEIIWSSALFAIAFACFIIYYFSQKILIKPLKEINNVADKIAKGEVDKRVKLESNDEIGELAYSFNSMADSLEKVEYNRREFLSNVSHEIRSPITSIRGFIGGILDGVIPKDKEKYYLSLTYQEIERLTRLVNDLLDLSAIESGKLKLNTEKVNISEIIRLTVIKFETKIMEKGIKVDVCFNDENIYSVVDRDRITQVITNLIDNAVKYVIEGGYIRISTRFKGGKVYISIFNNGPAIPEEDLKYIWDRFYKVDKSRTSKVSTGLGLPIVRSILTQHEEDIWVENKKNGGVEFTFTLGRAN